MVYIKKKNPDIPQYGKEVPHTASALKWCSELNMPFRWSVYCSGVNRTRNTSVRVAALSSSQSITGSHNTNIVHQLITSKLVLVFFVPST